MDNRYTTVLSEALMDPVVSSDSVSSTATENASLQNPSNPIDLTNDDVCDEAWDRFPWVQFPGYSKSNHSSRPRTSWIWSHGFRIQHMKRETIMWVCKLCVQQKRSPATRYEDTGGTKNMIAHLQEKHSIDKNGLVKKRKHEVFTKHGESIEQARRNRHVEGFKPRIFKRAMIRWIAHNNIAHVQVESDAFRDMMFEANPGLEKAGCLPSAKTIREWTAADFDIFSHKAASVLSNVPYNIHFTFDLWSADNGLGLNGVFAHWLDETGAKRKLLLSLPEIDESHTGENIAKGIAKIIRDWGLEDRIGYFVIDNAGNNNTCIDQLSAQFNFDAGERRLRCMCHILNLVAMAIMFGQDLEAFMDMDGFEDLEVAAGQLRRWRSTGPLGKLRNIIMWITDKHADGQRLRNFTQLKKELDENGLAPPHSVNSSSGIPKRLHHVSLKRPGDTRWNSHYFAYEAAIDLRYVLDEYCFRESRNHAKAVDQNAERNRLRGSNKKPAKDPEPPVPVTDSLTSEDWSVIVQYMEVLKPIMVASKRAEGNPKEGRAGMLWEVLPTFESLLHHLETVAEDCETSSTQARSVDGTDIDGFQHLKVNIQQGWQKLRAYYEKLDETPIIVVAFVLHPAYRIQKLRQLWSHQPEWIDLWMPKFQEIWQYYKQMDIGLKRNQPHPGTASCLESRQDFLHAFLMDGAELLGSGRHVTQEQADSEWPTHQQDNDSQACDEMDEFQQASDRSFAFVKDPVQFWIQNKDRWPHVSRMASVPNNRIGLSQSSNP